MDDTQELLCLPPMALTSLLSSVMLLFFFFLPSFKKIISGHAFYRICLLAVLLGRSQANLRKIKMFCFQTPVACKIYLIWLGWFHLILQSGGLSVHTFWMH